jgi:hypothetical protein
MSPPSSLVWPQQHFILYCESNDESPSLINLYHLSFIQRFHRYHTTSLVVRARRWFIVRKNHSAHVRRVEIDGALLHADEDDNERWVSTLEYDSAPETNLAPPCLPGKPIRLASWRWRMAQETHRTLLSSRQSVSFGDGSRIFFLRKKNNIPRDNSKRAQTQ